MTWLRGVLNDLADDSPEVDLAEQTIRIYERRRQTALSLVAAALLVVTALGVTTAVRLLPSKPDAATLGTVTDLPSRGVGPVSYAYRTFCQPETGKVPPRCKDGGWRVVTRTGRTYRVPEALPSLSGYRIGNYRPRGEGPLDSPLAISQDGRKIAYYGAEESTFVVRDLASGERWTAPAKVPEAWLGSLSHLLLSRDGHFLAFTKNPPLKDPAMLIDMRERILRPLPNGWNPIGLSEDGGTVTLAQYAPKSRLQTMSRLWTTSSAGNATTVDLPQSYFFSPLAPDGKTVMAIENRGTPSEPCRKGDLVRLDARTGEALQRIALSGLFADGHQISLRTWRSANEVTALTMPVQCRPAPKQDSSLPKEQGDPPYVTMTAYAVNIKTGKVRKISTYTAQSFFDIVLPGPTGAL
ncbi:hypothetical protein N5079_31895 [Planotetraspora sp. A-T 1434]|uniref:hypothetical protein n=1 Tax=Planotetraspora sp. A-T 1434 TaxID=2979219 RepID=UPI0021BF2B91|nr:hypothetical protein [Planotetraspora sp. A-T 1434]MCT9934818.1 hypothetical protein [Planotetraspora sp. A-T 1434]